MKNYLHSFFFIFCFSLTTTPASSQIIEGMEGALNGVSQAFSGDGAALDVITFMLDVGFYPTYGLFFGFENEPFFNDINYSPYPYDDGYSGMYRPNGEEGRGIQGQFLGHFQNNEDALNGTYFQLKFSPTRFLTMDVNHLRLIENRADNTTDFLNITNFALHYNRIRHQHFQLWWGGGLMVLEGDNLNGSATVTGGMTWFIKKPLSLYADMQLGWPNGIPAQLFQARMQAHVNRFMFYGGYQGVKIGRNHEPSWTIGTGIYF